MRICKCLKKKKINWNRSQNSKREQTRFYTWWFAACDHWQFQQCNSNLSWLLSSKLLNFKFRGTNFLGFVINTNIYFVLPNLNIHFKTSHLALSVLKITYNTCLQAPSNMFSKIWGFFCYQLIVNKPQVAIWLSVVVVDNINFAL